MVKFEEMLTIPTKPLMADGVVYRPSEGGILVPDVSSQVGKGQTKVQQALENNPLEQLRQSDHPRAKMLYSWIDSNEINKKWYLENVGTRFDLVEDGISILGNTWKLKDEQAEDNPDKGIWNNNGHTYFNFHVQQKLFGDSVPTKDDWNNLIKFLPGKYHTNKVDFLIYVLGLKFSGYRECTTNGDFESEGLGGFYWSSTSIQPLPIHGDILMNAYCIIFGHRVINEGTSSVYSGLSVRCFKK